MNRTIPLRRRTPLRSQSLRPYAVETRKKDRAWAIAVKKRDGQRCQMCGRGRNADYGRHIEAAHIDGKGAHPEKRHDLANGITLCAGREDTCHEWSHRNPKAFREWLRQRST